MKTTKPIYATPIVVLCVIILLLLPLLAVAAPNIAHAESTLDFDKTDVLADLEGSALNGVPFDVKDYPYDKNGELKVLGFVEYCYSDYENLRGNYGLYLYIYNPALEDISVNSNKIQMATEYDENGTATGHNKLGLALCSVSEGIEANRFLKFKVIGGEKYADKVDPTARTYYVSGVEFWIYGDKLPKELDVKTQYTWSGFAKGYGSTDAPLKCTAEEMDSIELSVQHTSYITGMSALGAGHYNQVNTVYFAVPNYYFDNFGNLQKILAEWYEYKLKPMAVTNDIEFYDFLRSHATHGNGEYSDGHALPGRDDFYLSYGRVRSDVTSGMYTTSYIHDDWAFNIKSFTDDSGFTNRIIYNVDESQDILPLVFLSQTEDPFEIFKFFNKWYRSAGSVQSNAIMDEIYQYANKLGHGFIDPEEKQISKDLFYDHVDAGRVMGYQQREVDFDDTFDLSSYESNHDWWDKLKDFGCFGKPDNLGDDYSNVRPIYDLQKSDFVGDDASVAKRLLVNESDVPALRDYYAQYASDNHIILFRYAVTDYMSNKAHLNWEMAMKGLSYAEKEKRYEQIKTYIASETVFFNFDIIQLTFNNDGEYRAFSVVSDPIDIVGDVRPPDEPKWPDDMEDMAQSIKDFFINIGKWLSKNWVWLVVGIVGGTIAIIIIIAIIRSAISRPKVTVVNQIPDTRSKKHGKKH